MNNHPTRIVAAGAGYAGLLAAVRLAGKTRRQNVSITLVNASDHFVERMRLHQLATNQSLRVRPIANILSGTGIQFIKGSVTAMDPAARAVSIEDDAGTRRLGYDYLLYAIGSTIERDSVPGIRENAFVLTPAGPLSAPSLRRVLPGLNEKGGRVVVCGGGATGIETAAEFAESYPGLEIQLITRDQFGMFLGKRVAAYMRQALERLGVVIRDRVVITEIQPHAITTSAGDIACDVCLWAGGFCAPPLAREAGVAVNERGQVLVDPFLRSISHPEIFAVGDAAFPVQEPGVPVRMSAYAAAILGAHGADSLAAVLRGKAPQPLSFAYLGQGIALGRHNSIGLNNYPDDKPHWPYFTGRIGYEGREFFVRLLADAPRLERQWPGLFTWVGKGRYAAAQRRLKARPVDAPAKMA